MMDEAMALNRRISIIPSLARPARLWLPVLGVLAACGLSFSSDMPIPIERPLLLGLGALAAVLPFASPSAGTLQSILVFYLMSIPLSELSARYFTISLGAARPVSICYSFPILLLCGIGYGAGRLVPRQTDLDWKRSVLVPAYVLAMAVIVAHMLGLSAVLTRVYGYGFERDLSTLGQVSLYFLLLLFSWRSLDFAWTRRTLALGLSLAYFGLAAARFLGLAAG